MYMAKLVIGKKDGVEKKDGSTLDFNDVAKQFAEDLGLEGVQIQVATSTDTPASSSTKNLVQYDSHGRPLAAEALAIHTAGFSVGMTVKADNTLYSIVAIQDDGIVQLNELEHPSQSRSVPYEAFIGSFKKTTETFEVFEDWQLCRPSCQEQYNEAVTRAYVLAAMGTVARDVAVPMLRIVMKPTRSISAGANYNVNKLQLFPETTKIVFDDRQASALKGTVGDKGFYLLPAVFNDTFAAPAWILTPTAEQDKANMQVSYRKVSVAIGDTKVDIHLPVYTNQCKVAAGDELFVYRPQAKKPSAKRPQSLNLQTAPRAKAKASAK